MKCNPTKILADLRGDCEPCVINYLTEYAKLAAFEKIPDKELSTMANLTKGLANKVIKSTPAFAQNMKKIVKLVDSKERIDKVEGIEIFANLAHGSGPVLSRYACGCPEENPIDEVIFDTLQCLFRDENGK